MSRAINIVEQDNLVKENNMLKDLAAIAVRIIKTDPRRIGEMPIDNATAIVDMCNKLSQLGYGKEFFSK